MSENTNEDGRASVRLFRGNAGSSGWTQWGRHQVCPGDWFDSALMVPNLRSQDRMGAIKELIDRMHSTGCVADSLDFLQSVLDREDLESTVVGSGVAFPHARCRSATRLGVAFGISRDGVDFFTESFPCRVHLICLLAVPVAGDIGYLPVLGMLTEFFQNQAFRMGLMACQTAEEMYRFLSPNFQKECIDQTVFCR